MRTKASTCARKQRFRGAAEAVAMAAGLPLRPYRCDRCRLFHLTSRTKGKRLRKPLAEPPAAPAISPT
jgi:hypothetical protein